MSNRIMLLYTTVDKLENANDLIHLALSNRLAACVNLIPNCQSVYVWNGKIKKDTEYYLLFKTNIASATALEALIVKHHPYDVPAILKFYPQASEKFFEYIQQVAIR